MVWNFRLHGQTPMAAAQEAPNSDHPSDATRASELTALFQSDRTTFGKFADDIALATPLAVQQGGYSQQYSYQRPQYPQYPQAQYPQAQYPQAQYPQYPQAQYPQYPQAQQGPYPPPPLPPCYPNC